ncbi:hypothetical protein I79_000008 [Cricetulus griseus]|uniref:Uncharacterized protein n=1 Tax=Cricetulus griseus TaxID=10029 RepID=G3GR65_CRIGR|nr:hypothetical protein I79_000008 [Cricetulus griseus]
MVPDGRNIMQGQHRIFHSGPHQNTVFPQACSLPFSVVRSHHFPLTCFHVSPSHASPEKPKYSKGGTECKNGGSRLSCIFLALG